MPLRHRRPETAALVLFRQRIRGLVIPTPCTVDALVATVSAWRGRTMLLQPMPAAARGVCGAWLDIDGVDHVFVEFATSEFHQLQIVAHELAHMILDHHRSPADRAAALAASLLPDVDPAVVVRALARGAYSTPQERDAERCASWLLARLLTRRGAPADVDDPTAVYLHETLGLSGAA